MSFNQLLFVFHAGTWHGFWTRSSHGISMVFVKKLMGFPSDSVSFPTSPPSERHEKIPVTFFTGLMYNIFCETYEVWNVKDGMLSLWFWYNPDSQCLPVKNVTGIFSCLFEGRLVENETKSDGNPIIFSVHAVEISWVELAQNPCHVTAWKTNKTWINDME